jgi:hypothetical protein
MQTKLFASFELPNIGDSGDTPEPSIDPSRALRLERGSPGIIWYTSQIGSGAAIDTLDGPTSKTQNGTMIIQSGFTSINFSDLIRELSGYSVLPIDLASEEDIILLKHLSQALTAFVRRTQKSGQRFRANRINDIGNRLESVIAEELRKTPLEAHLLGKPGYPDCVLKQGERITYLEIKTSASVHKGTNKYLRGFSFSSADKIESDGRHLLLKMQVEEEDSKIWRVIGWKLHDISPLVTRLKTEFVAGIGDLAEVRLLASSDKTARSLRRHRAPVCNESESEAGHANNREQDVDVDHAARNIS